MERCRLCGGFAHRVAADVPGYQEGRTYSIFECDKCFTSFASPFVVDDALYTRIYQHIQCVPGYRRYHSFAREVMVRRKPLDYLSQQEESYWAVTRYLRDKWENRSTVNVLDVGCGLGYFTHALVQDGYNAIGIDFSEKAIAWARKHFGPYYETAALRDLHNLGMSYDVIVMNQFLEHFPDVHAIVSEATELLAPGGELIVTTPNKSAYPGTEWETDLPPVHLWWFGEDALRHLARAHGCTITFISFEAFYRLYPRGKVKPTRSGKRQPIFNADGGLMNGKPIPHRRMISRVAESTGLLPWLQRVKILLNGSERWRGPRGPICAAVFKRIEE